MSAGLPLPFLFCLLALPGWCNQCSGLAVGCEHAVEGIEGVPVADFQELFEHDRQLKAREPFVRLERELTGASCYERNGFRLSDAPSGIHLPTPLLGEYTEKIPREFLDYQDKKTPLSERAAHWSDAC